MPRPSAQTVFRITGPVQDLPHGRRRGAGAARRGLHGVSAASSSSSSDHRARASRPSSTSSAGSTRASAGEAWFEDHELTRQSEAALTRYRRDHVGFIFQFYNLVPSLTARENVQAGDRDRPPADDAAGGAWRWSVSKTAWIISRPSSPAASSSAWPLPAPSPSGPTCCSATSRRAHSIRRPASACWRR